MTVPEGYEANVIYALGDSINPRVGDWDDNNIPSGTASSFALATAMTACIILA